MGTIGGHSKAFLLLEHEAARRPPLLGMHVRRMSLQGPGQQWGILAEVLKFKWNLHAGSDLPQLLCCSSHHPPWSHCMEAH
jgi:hypothetical protein